MLSFTKYAYMLSAIMLNVVMLSVVVPNICKKGQEATLHKAPDFNLIH